MGLEAASCSGVTRVRLNVESSSELRCVQGTISGAGGTRVVKLTGLAWTIYLRRARQDRRDQGDQALKFGGQLRDAEEASADLVLGR